MVRKLDDSIIGQYEKILGYGLSGTGKTFAAGTMPAPIFILCIGGDNELKTLRSPTFREKHPDKVDQMFFDSVKEPTGDRGIFEQAVAFDEACDKLDEALREDADPDSDVSFNSIVIDNATMLGNVQMNKAIEINHLRASDSSSTAKKRLRDYGIVQPGDNDWGSQMSLMTQFVNWLFGLEKHVFMIAHEWQETRTDRSSHTSTITARKPLFTGRNRKNIPLIFDNVWWFRTKGGGRARQYEVQTQGDNVTMAKTRMGGSIPGLIRDIDMEATIQRMIQSADD